MCRKCPTGHFLSTLGQTHTNTPDFCLLSVFYYNFFPGFLRDLGIYMTLTQ
uniref:Uncharacterized protein n=1 Tax=Anguilla anguilla TaxID=7936 RepID=A0A0E9WLV6_ANGAN